MELESDSIPFISVSGEVGVPRLPSSVIVADRKGIMCSVNDATCRLFGYSKNELIGQNIK
jgi:PAS domain-containing protein